MTFVPSLLQLPDPALLPAGIARGAVWSPNGTYCVVHLAVSPYIIIYKRVGETLTAIPTASRPSPTGETRCGTWTSDSAYYIYGQASPSPFMRTFHNNGDDTFTAVTTPASTLFGGDVAWSPDTSVVITAKNASPWIGAYGQNSLTFTAWTLAYVGAAISGRVYAATFSPDGAYLMAAGFSDAPYIWLYQLSDLTGTKLTLSRVTIYDTDGVTPLTVGGGINRVGWMKSKNVFAIISNDMVLRIVQMTGTLTAKVVRAVTVPGTGNSNGSTEFSSDDRKLYYTTDNGGGFVDINPTTFVISDPRGANANPPTTTEKFTTAIVAADGKQYVAVTGNDAPYFRWYKTLDRLANTQYGGYSVALKGAATQVNVAASFQSLTMAAIGANMQSIATRDYAPATAYVGMEALVPTVSQMFAEVADIEMAFKPLTSASLVRLRDPDILAASFQSLKTDAFVMVPKQVFADFAFGKLTTEASITIVPEIYAPFAFGALTTDILLSKPLYPSSLEMSFGALTSDGLLRQFDRDSIAASFGSLTTAVDVKVPVYYYAEFAFQSLTTDGLINVPIDAHLEMSFGALSEELVGDVPIDAHLAMSFNPLSAELVGDVPEAIWIAGSFGRLTAELEGNVPEAIWIAGSFSKLTADVVGNVPRAIWIDGTFSKFTMASEVKVPYPMSIEMSFGSLTAELEGNVPRAVWIEDFAFQPLTMAIQGGSTIGLDTRLNFGRLTTVGVIGYPIVIEPQDIVLPFVDVAGRLTMIDYLDGDLTMPGFFAEGELLLFYGIEGAIELPFVDVAGELAFLYQVFADIELPFIQIDGDLYMDMDLSGDIVLPFVEVRGSGAADTSGTGSAPTLIGDTDTVRLGGGVYFGFEALTIG